MRDKEGRQRPGDGWDEVWDAYEARHRAAPPAAARGGAARPRAWRGGALAVAMFGLGCLAGSAWPLLALFAETMRQDAPALLRRVDAAPARDALRQELRAHAGLLPGGAPDAAGRMLAAMADAMADDLAAPGGLHRMVVARGEAGGRLRHPAAVALPRLHAGPGMTLTLAPEHGPGGLQLRLAFAEGGWQAQGVALLDPPARADAALVLAGPGVPRPPPG